MPRPSRTPETLRTSILELIKAPPLRGFDPEAFAWTGDPAEPRTHLLEESPERGVMRMMIRVPAGGEIPHHEHYADEDVMVLYGAAEFVGDGGGIYEAGDILFSPRGTSHATRAVEGSDCVCYVVLYFGSPNSATEPEQA